MSNHSSVNENDPLERALAKIRASVQRRTYDEDLVRLFEGRMAELSSTAAVMAAQAERYWSDLDVDTRLTLVCELRAVERRLMEYRRSLCQEVRPC